MRQVLFIIAVFLPIILPAQDISVKSFRCLPRDMDARINHPVTDQNGDVAALIKVVTTETGFKFEAGSLGVTAVEQKTSEIWVYVPYGSRKITIKHPELGVLRNYVYPEAIKKATVYEMVLTTKEVETIVKEKEIKTEWLVVNTKPDGADVYINENFKGKTPLQMELEEGRYNYRITKEYYDNKAGVFEIDEETGKKKLDFNLDANFGYAKIVTEPVKGADIFVDGEMLDEKSNLLTGKLVSGTHKLTAKYPMYYDAEKSIEIKDGETTTVRLQLEPKFGTIEISTEPEDGAQVFLNGNNTEKTTPCEVNKVPEGNHRLRLEKEWFAPVKMPVRVKEGERTELQVEMKPNYGLLNISTHDEATISIDNEKKGKGEWNGKLIAGIHNIEVTQDKHKKLTKKIVLPVSEKMELELEPEPITGKLKIVTGPFDADIVINGEKLGNTPKTFNELLIGDYDLILKKDGYAEINKKITVKENETTSVNEKMTEGKNVNIKSNPSFAQVYIDDKKEGKTPINVKMSFDKHKMKLVKGEKIAEKTIEVKDDDKDHFEFELKTKRRWFVAYNGSINAPAGLTLGSIGRTGWYVSARTDILMQMSTSYEYGGNLWNPDLGGEYYYEINNTKKIHRMSVTVGLNQQLGENIYVYGGTGYGLKEQWWQMDIYSFENDEKVRDEYLKAPNNNYQGIEVEVGVIYKFNRILLNAGISSVNLKHTNITAGVGFSLKR